VYRPISAFGVTADIAGFLAVMVCPLLTQNGQTAFFIALFRLRRDLPLFSRYRHFKREQWFGFIAGFTSPFAWLGSIEPMEIDNQIAQASNWNRVFSFGSGISRLQ
jgi:hypothetical protein